MGVKVWRFDVEGTPHNVQLEHSYWSTGKRRIWADGQLVHESRKLFDTGSEHRFEVAGKACVLRIIIPFGPVRYELWVDGKLV